MIRTIRITFSFSLFLFLACTKPTAQVFQDIDSANIAAVKIEQGGNFGPCEPSIGINSLNTDNIVAGAILDKVYVSNDGGKTWTIDKLTSSHGVYGDPVVRADYKGNFYYAHLSNPKGKAYTSTEFLDRIVIQKSSDQGKTWTDGSFTLPRSPKDQDKQWLEIDPNDNTIYVTWTEFDLYASKSEDDHSRILFSKSVDDGLSWTHPQAISQFEGNCIDDDQTTEGAVPSVGPNGEVYVAWSYDEKIYFDRSFDKGETWLDEDIVVADQPEGWTITIPGLSRCNGMPITQVDRSESPYKGTIYVNWGDQRNGTDDTDIWFSSSTDHGTTWSEPIRVNDDDTQTHQFLSWMAVDQVTGHIYIVFYDRRHQTDSTTDVYLAYSTDGGKHFKNIKINSESFKPNPFLFFGDYNDISAHNGRVRPIWTQMHNNKSSVWTALIN
ncbi:MAG: exo-alpha-sialidase [Saprospiraceae bacterium]|nr:glycoside hydrolase [Bacteroidia bacterium]NNE13596.1 exo-alpha-sialidase [Saprospiraceae bacterium]NNL92921.1 exo-alpha-sialidase [Saprospiraceae bacterium]